MPMMVDSVAAISAISRLFCSVSRTSWEVQRYSKFSIVKRPDHVKVEKAAPIRTTIGAMMVKKQ